MSVSQCCMGSRLWLQDGLQAQGLHARQALCQMACRGCGLGLSPVLHARQALWLQDVLQSVVWAPPAGSSAAGDGPAVRSACSDMLVFGAQRSDAPCYTKPRPGQP